MLVSYEGSLGQSSWSIGSPVFVGANWCLLFKGTPLERRKPLPKALCFRLRGQASAIDMGKVLHDQALSWRVLLGFGDVLVFCGELGQKQMWKV